MNIERLKTFLETESKIPVDANILPKYGIGLLTGRKQTALLALKIMNEVRIEELPQTRDRE